MLHEYTRPSLSSRTLNILSAKVADRSLIHTCTGRCGQRQLHVLRLQWAALNMVQRRLLDPQMCLCWQGSASSKYKLHQPPSKAASAYSRQYSFICVVCTASATAICTGSCDTARKQMQGKNGLACKACRWLPLKHSWSRLIKIMPAPGAALAKLASSGTCWLSL